MMCTSAGEIEAQKRKVAIRRAGSKTQISCLPALGSFGTLPGKLY